MHRIEERSGRGGRRVWIDEYRQRSGQYLFLVTTEETHDGNTTRETTGFGSADYQGSLQRARDAMVQLADRPERADAPLMAGGSSHVHLPHDRAIGPATPGGPPEVEQVWQPAPNVCPGCGGPLRVGWCDTCGR